MDPQAVQKVLDDHGLSHKALGEMVGVTRRAVGQWLDGTNPVPDWAAERIGRVDTALRVQGGVADAVACRWPQEYLREHGGRLPPVLDTMQHLDTCAVCTEAAYGVVVAPAAVEIGRQG